MKTNVAEKLKRAEHEVNLVVAGTSQLLFNLADRTQTPELSQAEMITCQCCGHTWITSEADTIKKAWKQKGIPPGLGPLCDICWHLYSITNLAHSQGRCLKDVVHRFLKGRAKQRHVDLETVWMERR